MGQTETPRIGTRKLVLVCVRWIFFQLAKANTPSGVTHCAQINHAGDECRDHPRRFFRGASQLSKGVPEG